MSPERPAAGSGDLVPTCVALVSEQVARATLSLPRDVSRDDAREALLREIDAGRVVFEATGGHTEVHEDPNEDCEVDHH